MRLFCTSALVLAAMTPASLVWGQNLVSNPGFDIDVADCRSVPGTLIWHSYSGEQLQDSIVDGFCLGGITITLSVGEHRAADAGANPRLLRRRTHNGNSVSLR